MGGAGKSAGDEVGEASSSNSDLNKFIETCIHANSQVIFFLTKFAHIAKTFFGFGKRQLKSRRRVPCNIGGPHFQNFLL